MRIDNPYPKYTKPWRKGNLHAHSNAGHGDCAHADPDYVVEFYRDHCYDFMSLSDHDVLTPTEQYNTEDFICIPSVEEEREKRYNGDPTRMHVTYPGYPDKGKRIVAHPAWSGVTAKMINALDFGCIGIEVYNYVCSYVYGKGHSVNIWDELLVAGRRIWGFSVDDAHFNPDAPTAGGGWIQVQADELTQDAIMGAMARGEFYSTSGPEIARIDVDDNGVMTVESRYPCDSIVFVAHEHRGWRYYQVSTAPLLSAWHQLTPDMIYCRAEVRCGNKTAWTQPIFVGED